MRRPRSDASCLTASCRFSTRRRPAEVSAVNAWREAGATMAASVSAVANGAFEPTPEALAALNRNQESDR